MAQAEYCEHHNVCACTDSDRWVRKLEVPTKRARNIDADWILECSSSSASMGSSQSRVKAQADQVNKSVAKGEPDVIDKLTEAQLDEFGRRLRPLTMMGVAPSMQRS